MWEKKILMCRPDVFDIKYEINNWMNIKNKVNTKLAIDQWYSLHHLIIRCGGYVHYIESHSNTPDMVFTANAGIIKDKKICISSFKHPERELEEIYWAKWFLDNDYEVCKIPSKSNLKFEGAGDCLVWGDQVICGYGKRSDRTAGTEAAKKLGYDPASVKEVKLLIDKFYHLDTCFCPLDDKNALAYLPAFPKNTFNDSKKNIIDVEEKDAYKFACNSVVVGDNIIMPSGCENTANKLVALGYKVHLTNMSEFIKSGGACKCLTLEIN